MNTPTLNKSKWRSKGSCGGLLAVSLLTLSSLCQEVKAGQVWTGGGGNAFWSTDANWGGAQPVYGTGIQFDGLLQLTATNDLPALSIAGTGITFNVLAGAFTVNGNAITLAGGITNNSLSLQTVSFAGITLGAAQTFNAGLGGLNVSAPIVLGGFALGVDGTANTTLSGAISGTGQLNKTGLGTLILSGTNTFDGPTTVTQGIMQLQNGAAIADTSAVIVNTPGSLDLQASETIGSLAGSGDTTLNANTLTTGGDGTSTAYSGVLSGGGGSLVKNGAGTFTTSGANTYTGATTVNTGTLNVLGTHLGGGDYTIAAGAALAGTGVITETPGASIFNNGAIVVGDANLLPPRIRRIHPHADYLRCRRNQHDPRQHFGSRSLHRCRSWQQHPRAGFF